jgi:hypothetical protein
VQSLSLRSVQKIMLFGVSTFGPRYSRGFDLASSHLALAPAFASLLAGHFKPCPGALHSEFTLHLGSVSVDKLLDTAHHIGSIERAHGRKFDPGRMELLIRKNPGC